MSSVQEIFSSKTFRTSWNSVLGQFSFSCQSHEGQLDIGGNFVQESSVLAEPLVDVPLAIRFAAASNLVSSSLHMRDMGSHIELRNSW